MYTKNRRLVFIGNTAWSMYNFRRQVLQYFIEKGNDVIVISPADSIYQSQLQSLGCRYYSVSMEAKGYNPLKDLYTMWRIRLILKKEKPDFCFFYTIKPNIYASFVATLLSIPYVPITTGLGYIFLVDNFISKMAKLLYKIAFKNAVQVWFLNKDDVNAFKQEKLVSESKISILKGEGIDINRFEVHHKSMEISFLLIARMLWDKGIGEFVEAAQLLKKKYPTVRFKLLGFLGVDNPSAISDNQMKIWEQEGSVEYLGTTDDVRPYIYASSCIVLPSYREGIPFSLMEGAASGKPLIAANSIGCKEVVDDGVTGYLCKVKDAMDLAKCMENIILMPIHKRKEMGMKGRVKMQKEFGVDIVIDKYIQILNQFVK